jgi:carboxypeptidase family protein/TonB-dependent receptor-like protein
MSLRPISVWLFAILFAASPANKLNAQTTTSGGLTGVVTDPSHAVVSGASVEIKDNARGTTQSTKTDREGVYRFFFLAPERYTLTVSHGGFRTENRTVNVRLGPPVSVNVTLQLAKATTSVSVIAEAPLVQAENGDVSVTMNQKQISEVPNPGNDLTYIVQTAPGVVMNTDQQVNANFSILGMPGTSYLYTMDGMNDNDNAINLSMAGTLFLLLGQNQIQEATVVSTGYSGQFGGAAGGDVNYITKSGGNQFHGNAQYYWNGRVLNANDWFDNAFSKPRPFDIANQWAGSLGGPIKRDKLFFFFDTEGMRLVLPQPSFVLIPSPQFEAATITNIDSDPRFGPNSPTDAFYKKIFNLYNAAPGASSASPGGLSPTDPSGCTGFTGLGTDPHTNKPVPCAMNFLSTRSRPSQDTLASGRLDSNVTSSDRAFFRLQYDGGRGAIYTDPISPAFDSDYTQPWWQGQIVETHTFGNAAASQFLLAGTYFAPIFRSKNSFQALTSFPTTLSFALGSFNTLGSSNMGGYGLGRYNTQYQLSEDVVKIWHNQKFGFGGNFARTLWSELPNKINASGLLTVQTLKAFYDGGIDPANPTTDFTQLAQSFTKESNLPIAFLNFGLYGQDEWHARSNLTITAALRIEHYSIPVCRNGCFARLSAPFASLSHDPGQPYKDAILTNQKQAPFGVDNILWSPRLSFAWQPRGVSQNLVIRGGVGIFYDPLPGRALDFSANPPLLNSFFPSQGVLAPDETGSLFQDAEDSNKAFLKGFDAGQTVADMEHIVPDFFPPSIVTAARRMHSPQYQRWSFQLEEALGVNTSFSLGYFGHHGIHELVQNPNANAYGFGSLPAAQCTTPPVPPCSDPRFSEVLESDTNAVSNYHGLVASFDHRLTRWTQGRLQANYTYSHALDEVSNGGLFPFTGIGLSSPQDPGNLRGAYGPADYDVRHSFNANYVWEVPLQTLLGGRGPKSLTTGWQISGTIFARTGFPYTVFDFAQSGALQPNDYFGLLYAVPVGPLAPAASCGESAAIPLAPKPCQPSQVFVLPDGTTTPNPGAHFLQAGCETGFNAGRLGASGVCDGVAVAFAQGRDRYRGPAYFNTDFALMKTTKIPGSESAVFGIGFQFFNFFNHPNFGFPDPGLSSPTFGKVSGLEGSPTSILGSGFGGISSPRMIQLKAQFQF